MGIRLWEAAWPCSVLEEARSEVHRGTARSQLNVSKELWMLQGSMGRLQLEAKWKRRGGEQVLQGWEFPSLVRQLTWQIVQWSFLWEVRYGSLEKDLFHCSNMFDPKWEDTVQSFQAFIVMGESCDEWNLNPISQGRLEVKYLLQCLRRIA